MKKMFLLLIMISAATFSFANTPVSEKVLKIFRDVYPNVENAKWYENENSYEVYFEKDDVKCRIRYDIGGKLLSTTRYYSENTLAPFLRVKVAQKFKGKKVFGITELTTEDQLFYEIILEDDKHWYHVHSDGMGQMTLAQKLNKSEK